MVSDFAASAPWGAILQLVCSTSNCPQPARCSAVAAKMLSAEALSRDLEHPYDFQDPASVRSRLGAGSLMGIGSIAFPAFAFACDDQAQTKHYEVAVPGTVREANELMQSAMPRIEIAYAAQAQATGWKRRPRGYLKAVRWMRKCSGIR